MEGTQLVFAGRGRAAVAYMAREVHGDRSGSVRGGTIATLLAEAMEQALGSLLERGDRATTTEQRASYRRPVRVESGPVRAEAGVLHVGPASALLQARLVDAEGRVFADATATWALERRAALAA